MAVPKRKTPRSKTHSRRSANMKLAQPAKSICPQCGAAKQPHRVCGTCGTYRGRQVIDVG
jgi:large subunit ribosomal protein L32